MSTIPAALGRHPSLFRAGTSSSIRGSASRRSCAYPAPWELIVIDNGSTDGTAAYLADVRDTAPVPVTVIANTRNLGFPAAINQGLECARGEYLVLLNNDVVVTDGWVEQLVGLVSIRGRTESDEREKHVRLFTTESTEDTEFEEGKGDQFREVKDAYPGRDITVIDLCRRSLVHNPKSRIENRKLGLLGRCRIMRRRRSWLRMCLIGIWARWRFLRGDGGRSIVGNGCACPSFLGFAC